MTVSLSPLRKDGKGWAKKHPFTYWPDNEQKVLDIMKKAGRVFTKKVDTGWKNKDLFIDVFPNGTKTRPDDSVHPLIHMKVSYNGNPSPQVQVYDPEFPEIFWDEWIYSVEVLDKFIDSCIKRNFTRRFYWDD